MIICGLKLTHDGAITLIDNGKLIFCYEIEKLNNNERYSDLKDLFSPDYLNNILKEYNYSLENVNEIVIDGWGDFNAENISGTDWGIYKTKIKDKNNQQFEITLNSYGMCVKNQNLLQEKTFSYPANGLKYNSYMHITGHLLSGYCTSSFAKKGENSFILIWDGGLVPQLFYLNYKEKKIETLGEIFHLLGVSYSLFANNYPPYNHLAYDDLSIAGKLMAYIALGKCNQQTLIEFKKLFKKQEEELFSKQDYDLKYLHDLTSNLLGEFVMYGELNDIDPKDMMTTFHVFLQDILLEKLQLAINKYPSYTKNLCFVGGCALNIKWNSNIRNSGLFNEMWVPPFPNDSGSAIGAACCEMINKTGRLDLEWDVYKGPFITKGNIDTKNWEDFDFSINELANLLHTQNQPVVFLNGRAELGPRALGNRSILAAPVNSEMKKILNKVKKREDYRPVAPICMEEDAKEIFSPGLPDPLMLYDHLVKENWKEKIPAICHLDGTARLQTINKNDNPLMYELIEKYKALSGVPLLCNTSANFNGKGFFPDVESALEWGQTDMVWCENKMYVKKSSPVYSDFWSKRVISQ